MKKSNNVVSVENVVVIRKEKPIKNGLVVTYNDDGTVRSEIYYTNDIRDGICNWYSNGHLTSTAHYKDGKEHGTSIQYHAPGKILNIQNYKDGKHHGQVIKFYEYGMIESIDLYNEGKKHGWCAEFDILGKTIQSVQYENGELQYNHKWIERENEIMQRLIAVTK